MNELDPRVRLIRLIHVGKRELGLSDETYRALLAGCTRKDSTTRMSVPELERVFDRMKHSGFKVQVKSARHAAAQSKPSRPLAQSPQARKIRALWLSLHTAGAVRNASEAALAAYVQRQTGIAALQWLDSAQAGKIIESLKSWLIRVSGDRKQETGNRKQETEKYEKSNETPIGNPSPSPC
ncbi:MAG: regulatory protein GemA [Candidatus Accumulibacter sp.]|jgi:phage gp16-like protein|nr:regulatory protein GemA [Accumulibacter sp.]